MDEKIQKIIKNVPEFSEIVRGTLIERYVKCKTKKCKCHLGEKIHGPNWYLVYRENKKTNHIYISKTKKKLVDQYIKNYQNLKKILNELSKLNLKIIKKDGN